MLLKTTFGLSAIIGQSGGPTSAINATLAGVIDGCFSAGFRKVYGMKNGVEGLLHEKLIDLREFFPAGSEDALRLLALTPGAALGSCRKKLKGSEDAAQLFRIFDAYDVGAFFYIGGNDSMDAVAKLADYAGRHPELRPVKLIGVPKTIDNDLVHTDHTPGFGSAAKYIAAIMQEIMRDCAVYDTKAVTIVEVMGRDAGWLTASASLSKAVTGVGPSLIYLPECPFSEERFLHDIRAELENGEKPYVVAAVSEGLRGENGAYIGEKSMSGASDSFGHKYLAGTGKYLETLVRRELHCKVRSVEINILQRCAGHAASKTDIEESVAIGRQSVQAALDGKSGVMTGFVRMPTPDGSYRVSIDTFDVRETANRVRHVPQAFINEAHNGVTDLCIDYLLPLIQGECSIPYRNGVPQHFSF